MDREGLGEFGDEVRLNQTATSGSGRGPCGMEKGEKTVRFAAVVKKAGAPVNYLLWSTPGHDEKFKRAVSEEHVMTIHREVRGTHADHGEVGYRPDRHAQFLLFPKSLRKFRGRRVIGIDYDLLAKGVPTSNSPALPSTLIRTSEPKVVSPKSPPNMLHFPKEERAVSLPKPVRAKVAKPMPHLDPHTAGQIREAVHELKTGRYVAAYTRLNQLLTPRVSEKPDPIDEMGKSGRQ